MDAKNRILVLCYRLHLLHLYALLFINYKSLLKELLYKTLTYIRTIFEN